MDAFGFALGGRPTFLAGLPSSTALLRLQGRGFRISDASCSALMHPVSDFDHAASQSGSFSGETLAGEARFGQPLAGARFGETLAGEARFGETLAGDRRGAEARFRELAASEGTMRCAGAQSWVYRACLIFFV